jgi:hypothetical protein
MAPPAGQAHRRRDGQALGATVIASRRARQARGRQAHGADHLIDYRSENIRDRVKEICSRAAPTRIRSGRRGLQASCAFA